MFVRLSAPVIVRFTLRTVCIAVKYYLFVNFIYIFTRIVWFISWIVHCQERWSHHNHAGIGQISIWNQKVYRISWTKFLFSGSSCSRLLWLEWDWLFYISSKSSNNSFAMEPLIHLNYFVHISIFSVFSNYDMIGIYSSGAEIPSLPAASQALFHSLLALSFIY